MLYGDLFASEPRTERGGQPSPGSQQSGRAATVLRLSVYVWLKRFALDQHKRNSRQLKGGNVGEG
jgi:hypothetical protein